MYAIRSYYVIASNSIFFTFGSINIDQFKLVPMPILLKNATFIHWKTLEFIQTDILVNEGIDASIKFLDKDEKLTDNQNITKIDCQGKLVTKSFAVGHHHVYSALATGMPAPKKNPDNFFA